MTTTEAAAMPDRRVNAWREDLAASELRGAVEAPRYVEGELARVVTSVLAVRRQPSAAAPLETEALFGERVRVLDWDSGWAWVQLVRDRYVGYVVADALSRELIEPTHRVQALGTFVYPEPDIKSPTTLHLPLGADITVEREDARFARLATGGFVITRHIAERSRFARDFVDVAERFIGTPYLWGGRTRTGLDCSGLVQISLEAAGIRCPRDSDMQEAELGTPVLVPDPLDGLERGDLVFWPGHAGIMVDGVMLLHANAHHMAVAVEPLKAAAERIRRTESAISSIRRLPALTAAA
jgi:cell wall-associated NlpC family hydrolase